MRSLCSGLRPKVWRLTVINSAGCSEQRGFAVPLKERTLLTAALEKSRSQLGLYLYDLAVKMSLSLQTHRIFAVRASCCLSDSPQNHVSLLGRSTRVCSVSVWLICCVGIALLHHTVLEGTNDIATLLHCFYATVLCSLQFSVDLQVQPRRLPACSMAAK